MRSQPKKIVLILLSLLFIGGSAAGTAWAQEPAPSPAEYDYTVDWTTSYSRLWLRNLGQIVGKPGVQGLEIGCFEGRSTIWFVRNVLTDPSAHMTCIDVFTEDIEKAFDHNLQISGLSDRITKLKGYSQDELRKLEYASYDFIYIDGCHLASCVMTDAVLAWDLLKLGGVMIFDDYSWRMDRAPSQRPKLAIDAFTEAFIDSLYVTHVGTQLIVQKIKGRSKTELVGKPIVHEPEWEEKRKKARDRDGN